MNKTVKIIAAFTVGAAAGSLLGLLLAPGNSGACGDKAAGDEKGVTDATGTFCAKKRKGKDRKEYAGVEQDEIL